MVLFYDPSAIGTVQFAIAFVSIFSFIFNVGFSIAHLKIYPEEENKASCIGTLLSYKVLFIFLSLIFYFTLLSFMNLDSILLNIILIFIFDLIIQSINTSFSNILIADDKTLKATFPWIVISSSKIVLLIISLFLFSNNILTLSIIYLLSSVIHSGFLLIYIFPYKIVKPKKILLKKYLKYTYPLIFSNVILMIGGNIGIILINFWVSSEAVAFYYVGDHLSVFRTIIPNVISLVMISIFSKNIADNKAEKNNFIIAKVSKYFCIFWGGIIILSFLYSDEIIIIFMGKNYFSSIFVFNVLVLAQIIIINDIAVYTDLNARGLTKLYSTIMMVGEFYNIFLMILFIAPFGLNLGINGLALSILFRYLTYNPIVRFFLWKKYNYKYNLGIFLYLFVALIVIIVNHFFYEKFSIDLTIHFYLIPFFMIVNFIIYFGILYLLRVIKKEDIKYIKLLLNIKNLINLLYEDLAIKNNGSEN